jgi:DnaK suppressor protein
VRGVPKKPLKKAIKKAVKKAAKKVAKKAPAKKVAKKAPAKKAPAKKVAAKKAPAKAVKKNPGRPFPSKTTLTVDEKSQTVSVKTIVAPQNTPVVEERRLVMPPPARPVKSGKKIAPLKPIKQAPTPIVVSDSESAWNAAELKAIRSELAKDQADAGTKTFEREHEMSLVINARDMVLQTERALERIDTKTYGNCEECGSPIGKARLQVFPRATLCMLCKQKEERR